jgi:NADH-quinone oxidoreductase subunit J
MLSISFIILAALTLVSAVAAMSLRNLVHCALCLVVTLAGLAGLFLQLNAQFVGFAQVLVYIGAVAILILFAILLTRSSEMGVKGLTSGSRSFSSTWCLGLAVAVATFGAMAVAIRASHLVEQGGPTPVAVTVNLIGTELMNKYLLPLEVLGLLLTAALIGAALIAMREKEGK